MTTRRSLLGGAVLPAALGLLSPRAARSAAAPSIASPASRILLTWSGNPARTQDVTWRTDSPTATPQGQIVKVSPSPKFPDSARTVNGAAVQDDVGDGKIAGHNAVHFADLEPATFYNYRVGDGKAWSEWGTFRTAADKADAFRFLYVGDAQNNIRSMWSRTIRTAYATAPDARFITHAGDLLAEGYDDRLWGEWTDSMSFISATIPSVPVPGNHDLHRAPNSANAKTVFQVSPLWQHHFRLPSNGPSDDLRSQSYFMDYQGVRVIALDVNVFANEDFDASARDRVRAAELAWVEKTLASNSNRWTVVLQHQPIYAMAKGREYAEMREALAPLYEKYGVDVVLQGHDHLYSRTHKIAGGKIVDPSRPGVVYVISVSGPKMYEIDPRNRGLMAVVLDQKQFFQVVDVSHERFALTAYSVDGTVRDRFELQKTGASGSTYVNLAPTN